MLVLDTVDLLLHGLRRRPGGVRRSAPLLGFDTPLADDAASGRIAGIPGCPVQFSLGFQVALHLFKGQATDAVL